MTKLPNRKTKEEILFRRNYCKHQLLGDRDLLNRVGKKILAGPEQKLPLERRNFGNYFLENEATWYIEHFTSSCILFIALLDKNIRNIKIENLRKFQKKSERDGLFRNYFREICKSYGILCSGSRRDK